MNQEILNQLEDINKKIDDNNNFLEYIENNTQFSTEAVDDLRNSNVNVLSIIFGFIVGYCLIKSFFDGYKI